MYSPPPLLLPKSSGLMPSSHCSHLLSILCLFQLYVLFIEAPRAIIALGPDFNSNSHFINPPPLGRPMPHDCMCLINLATCPFQHISTPYPILSTLNLSMKVLVNTYPTTLMGKICYIQEFSYRSFRPPSVHH